MSVRDFYENKRPVVDLVYLPGDLWKREVYLSVNGIDRFMLPGNEEV